MHQKMQIQACTLERYHGALIRYYDRMNEEQRHRAGMIDRYMSRARYMAPGPRVVKALRIRLPMTVYTVYNEGVEYDFPHTLEDIIILPWHMRNASIATMIQTLHHELMHVYFHHYPCRALGEFCTREGIIRIRRPWMRGEIINPDTTYHTGMWCPVTGVILFIALIDNGREHYDKAYHAMNSADIRPATEWERRWYDWRLPYEQNEHPEEIIATIMGREL